MLVFSTNPSSCSMITNMNSRLTKLNHRFRSLDSLDIDSCDYDIIPYKIDIQTIDAEQSCPFAAKNDDKNEAFHVTYRPKAAVTYVNLAVLW